MARKSGSKSKKTKSGSKSKQTKNPKLPFSPGKNSLSVKQLSVGFGLVAVVSVLFFMIMRGQFNGSTKPAENSTARMPSAIETLSRSSVEIVSDKDTGKVDVEVTGIPSSKKSGLMEDIKFATKGDGAVREVDVNGKKVDESIVKLAMFENQDFQPRLEDKTRAAPKLVDQRQAPQKSHFRRMTYPLVWDKGALGTDQMHEGTKDLRVNIAASNGRQ